jgi:hypothetical protein
MFIKLEEGENAAFGDIWYSQANYPDLHVTTFWFQSCQNFI